MICHLVLRKCACPLRGAPVAPCPGRARVVAHSFDEQAPGRWARRPPAARVNYKALGVECPWVSSEAWRALVSSQSPPGVPAAEPHVLRGMAALECVPGEAGRKEAQDDGYLRGGLVGVRVEVVGRGVPKEHAVVWASGTRGLKKDDAAGCGDAREAGACKTRKQPTEKGHGRHGAGRAGQEGGRPLLLGYITAGWYDSWQGRGVGRGFLSAEALSQACSASPVAPWPLRVEVRNTASSSTMECCAFICP